MVTPSLSVSDTYDTNVNYASTKQSRQEDFVTTLSPQIAIKGTGKEYSLDVTYRLDSVFYKDDTSFNYTAHNARLDMEKELSKKTTLGLHDTFVYTKESLEAVETGIQTGRTNITSNTATVDLSRTLTERLSAVLSAADSVLDYEDPGFVDSRTDSGRLSARYAVTENKTLFMTYGFTNFAFDNADSNDIQSHSLVAGITGDYTRSLTYSVQAGAFYTPDVDDRVDFTAGVDVKKSFESSSLSAGYEHTVTNSSGLTNEISITDRAYAGAGFNITRTLDAGISGDYSKNRSEPSTRLQLTSYSAGADIHWKATEWLTVGAGYRHFRQEAEDTLGNDILRDRVFVNLTAVPGQWRL